MPSLQYPVRSLWLALSIGLAACGGGSSDQPADPLAATDRVHAQALAQRAAGTARWTAPIGLSLVPVAGAVQADGKVLFWSADGRFSFGGSGHTWSTLFDPGTQTAAEHDVTETGHDMFCPGTARLADGRLLVHGGLDAGTSSLYDPQTRLWSRAAGMNIARGYNASAVLADASVLTLGGSWSGGAGGKSAEVYTPQSGWRVLRGIPEDPFLLDGVYRGWQSDAHMSLIPTANGKVLLAGPTPRMAWLDTRGDGTWMSAGPRGDDTPSFAGPTVMFDGGKILKVGGATWNNTPASASAYLIDTTSGQALPRKLTPMAYPRVYANSVVLPDGQVLVVGGQTAAVEFSDANAVLAPELWNPRTEAFTVLPPMSVARNYHSIAMLLPDGRVLSAGGGLCNCPADHADLQILSPPYLFNEDGSAATRPVLAGVPAQLGYGNSMDVTTDGPVSAFSMVRLGAVTHTVNNDQRRLALNFSAQDSTHYRVEVPSNPGLLLPGQWMVFAMNAAGTPSLAKIVTIDNQNAPQLDNPGSTQGSTGQYLSLALHATSPVGTLSFSATGLPPGLSIDPVTGTISGTPSTTGSFLVTVKVSNGSQTVSTDFNFDFSGPAAGGGLLAQYFANTTLSGAPVLQRNEAPNFDWGGGSPGAGVPPDNFSVRWSGTLEAIATGDTLLQTVSDDGVRVWLDGQLIIDNWTSHAATTNSANVRLVAGRRSPLVVEFNEYGGAATLRLNWQPPGAAGVVAVPATRLYGAAAPSVVNLAQGAAASQSSTYGGAAASRAVDGSTDGDLGHGSVTHTGNNPQEWWQVDLGQRSRIDRIQLWNRSDCCGDRLQNFVVMVALDDMSGRTLEQLQADPAVLKRAVGASNVAPQIGIPVDAAGRFVRVQLAGQNYLSLAEVQVFGVPDVYHAPAINAVADAQTVLGNAVSLAVQATDPDGHPLTYAAEHLPPGLAIDPRSGLISGTPTAVGIYGVTASARNDGGLSASTSFTWTVLDVMPAVSNLPAPVGKAGRVLSYAPVLTPGAPVQFSWQFGDGSGDTPWSDSGAASHVFAAPGVYSVTLSLRSSDGRSASHAFLQAVVAPGAVTRPVASSPLLWEARKGSADRLWVVNPDNDSVSVFDTVTRARLAEIPVGASPRAVARNGRGLVVVTNKADATISVIDPEQLAVVGVLALPRASQPAGLLFSPVTGNGYVALEATGQVLMLNGRTGAVKGSLQVGPQVRHLALNGAGDLLLATRFITPPLPGEGTANVGFVDAAGRPVGGEVLAISPSTLALQATIVLQHSERPDTESQGRGVPNYLGGAAIAPDGRSAWVPSKQDNVQRGSLRDGNNLNFQNTVRAISSRIDLVTRQEDLPGRVDHDNASVASAAVYHPTGAYLFVALETNRQVAVLDPAGRRELFRIEVGLAPQGLMLSANGRTLYVANFMSRTVSEIDLLPLLKSGLPSREPVATLAAVATDKLAADVLRGKQLFYDARDPRLARDSYMSCASCHNDAGHDGRVWDLTGFGEGLRNTIALRGRAGMGHGFLHWSANFDEVQDFEGQIRNLAGGTGLMSDADFLAGSRSQPLGDRKTGLSPDLDALAAYVGSLSVFAPSPARNPDGSLSSAALAGQAVFKAQNCAACHGGTAFSISADLGAVKDIGTIKPSSGHRLFGPLTGIDVPTLRDAWATAPYLHDGSAPTLAAAVLAHRGVALAGADLDNLVQYLREIGAEEPAPPAAGVRGAGRPWAAGRRR